MTLETILSCVRLQNNVSMALKTKPWLNTDSATAWKNYIPAFFNSYVKACLNIRWRLVWKFLCFLFPVRVCIYAYVTICSYALCLSSHLLPGLEKSTRPLVFTSASDCRASEILDDSQCKLIFYPYMSIIFVMQGKCLFWDISRPDYKFQLKKLSVMYKSVHVAITFQLLEMSSITTPNLTILKNRTRFIFQRFFRENIGDITDLHNEN